MFTRYQVERKCSVSDNFSFENLVYLLDSRILFFLVLSYIVKDESYQFSSSLSSPNVPFHILRSLDFRHHLKILSSDSQSSSIVLFLL